MTGLTVSAASADKAELKTNTAELSAKHDQFEKQFKQDNRELYDRTRVCLEGVQSLVEQAKENLPEQVAGLISKSWINHLATHPQDLIAPWASSEFLSQMPNPAGKPVNGANYILSMYHGSLSQMNAVIDLLEKVDAQTSKYDLGEAAKHLGMARNSLLAAVEGIAEHASALGNYDLIAQLTSQFSGLDYYKRARNSAEEILTKGATGLAALDEREVSQQSPLAQQNTNIQASAVASSEPLSFWQRVGSVFSGVLGAFGITVASLERDTVQTNQAPVQAAPKMPAVDAVQVTAIVEKTNNMLQIAIDQAVRRAQDSWGSSLQSIPAVP